MSKKAMGPAEGFSLAVIAEIRRAIKEIGITNGDLIKRSGMSQDYFYKRMRGEYPFNTNDISRIADALGMDAFIILRRAAQQHTSDNEERERRTLEKIARHDMTLAAYKDEEMDREAEDFGA